MLHDMDICTDTDLPSPRSGTRVERCPENHAIEQNLPMCTLPHRQTPVRERRGPQETAHSIGRAVERVDCPSFGLMLCQRGLPGNLTPMVSKLGPHPELP